MNHSRNTLNAIKVIVPMATMLFGIISVMAILDPRTFDVFRELFGGSPYFISMVIGIAASSLGLYLRILLRTVSRREVYIFIAYAHLDDELYQKVTSMIKQEANKQNKGIHIESWNDIMLGENIKDAVSRMIDKADVILPIASSNYFSGESCKSEFEYMRKINKKNHSDFPERHSQYFSGGIEKQQRDLYFA